MHLELKGHLKQFEIVHEKGTDEKISSLNYYKIFFLESLTRLLLGNYLSKKKSPNFFQSD